MLTLLVLLEAAGAVLGVVLALRGARLEAPRRGRVLGIVSAAAAVHVLATRAHVGVLRWALPTGQLVEGRALASAIAGWGIEAARFVSLLFAIRAWAELTAEPTSGEREAPALRGSTGGPAGPGVTTGVRFRKLHRHLVLLAVAIGVEVLQATRADVLHILAFIALVGVFLLAPREWIAAFRGRRRVLLGLIAFLGLRLFDERATGLANGATVVPLPFYSPGSPAYVLDAPPALAQAARLAAPWTLAARAIADLLAIQSLAALLRAAAPRRVPRALGMRRVGLRQRFMLTYVLVRAFPAMIGLVLAFAGVYFAAGLHKASRVTEAFERTLERADDAAWALLAEPGPVPTAGGEPPREGPGARRGASQGAAPVIAHDVARRWLGRDASTARLVLRPAAPGDSLPYRGLSLAPEEIRLTATRVAADRARVVSVEVPLDSLYLARVAREAGVTIRVETRPATGIVQGGSTITIGPADSTWHVSTVVAWAPDPADAGRAGLFGRRRYLARTFLPVSDWSRRSMERRPVVTVTLQTSLSRLFEDARGSVIPLAVTVGTPAILLAAAALLLAEAAAVRMGRGIARVVLDDVAALAEGVRRIGSGDLDHKVPVGGRDELGKLATAFNEMAANIRRHQVELIEKERLEADLAVARAIQARLLPQRPPVVAGLEVTGVSAPSREVGGDLFAFLPASGGGLGVALGDVSGKSVPAALLMANVLASLKAQAQHGADVDESLVNMNRLIAQDIEPGRFVTIVYAVIDPRAGRVRYACAGHNPPLLVRASGEVAWLRESGLPLGILEETSYAAADAMIAPGDVLVFYSDGVTEAECARPADAASALGIAEEGDATFFGEDRLVAATLARVQRPASEILEGIVEDVRRFAVGAPQADDLTLVVVRMT